MGGPVDHFDGVARGIVGYPMDVMGDAYNDQRSGFDGRDHEYRRGDSKLDSHDHVRQRSAGNRIEFHTSRAGGGTDTSKTGIDDGAGHDYRHVADVAGSGRRRRAECSIRPRVIGGLAMATFATLFFVPVVYSLLRGKAPETHVEKELM